VASTPIFMCIGLNYAHHAKEANARSLLCRICIPTNPSQLAVPSNPVVFTKPADALAGPYDDISIHPDAQSQLDYEGELCVIIGKDCKNVSEGQAWDYILGYTVGNDVSARNFQIPATVSGGQFGYAKSFDNFAPIGPAVLLAKGVDPHKLKYTTKVNGQIRQETGTDDMIWSIPQIVAHLSRGTTLRKGTVLMTGTPSGVGIFMEPKGFLKDGDVVEIEVEGIGKIANKMVFEK
jgi:2-keto-4-pentenoate hydratase/2-oxohepta-3-ene-1,7-dioic acid hydratase in catechol pathway